MLVPQHFHPHPDAVLQIPEFIEFEDRLENSLQRDLAKMEHVRMRVFHEPVNADLTDMELIELKFIFARRKSGCCTPRISPAELLCQSTMTIVTTTSLPTINPGAGLRSLNSPLYSGRNPRYVFIICHVKFADLKT